MGRAVRTRQLEGAFRYRHAIEIRYGDTDALGHVNNAVYLSYFEAARGGYYTVVMGHPFGRGPDAEKRTFVIAEAHVAYRQPARLRRAALVLVPRRLGGPFLLRPRVPRRGGGPASRRPAPRRRRLDGPGLLRPRGREGDAHAASLLAGLRAYEGHELPTRPGGA